MGIVLTNNTMPEPGGSGLEAAMHRAPGMEGFVVLKFRTVEDLDRVATRVLEFKHLQNMALGGLLVGADPELNSGIGQLPLHFAEFFTARDPKAEVRQVVAAPGMHHNPMMP